MSVSLSAVDLENANLKKQAEGNKQAFEGMLAQLDAHKQMLNDQLQQGLQLRTNQVLLQKECGRLNEELANVKKQLAEANAKLEAPKAE